jgi:hypothetical protein
MECPVSLNDILLEQQDDKNRVNNRLKDNESCYEYFFTIDLMAGQHAADNRACPVRMFDAA